MASPYLVDPIKPIDPVDALRLLVVDVQALADRLALRQANRGLQQLLDATQERVFGPRTVIMLMGETAAVKRRFLERLLGPQLNAVPEPATGCLRLQYGAEAECTVSLPEGLTAVMPLEQVPDFLARQGGEMPQHSRQTVRLPNAALARGLAIIDTPAMETLPPSGDVENIPWLLEAAAQADCWIFVLGVDQEPSEQSLALLRQLPRPCGRLDIVVEGAESLSGEARQREREQLLRTLEDRCSLENPRLTLLASPSAEGEAGGFWNGRFASFQSVTLIRGREHWLHTTRVAVAEALSAVGEEIQAKLLGGGLDLHQARLRLGQKDLEVLRTRFDELGLLMTDIPRQSPSLVSAVIWPETSASAQDAPEREAAAEDRPATSGPPQSAANRVGDSDSPAVPPKRIRSDRAAVQQTPASKVDGRHAPPWRQGDATATPVSVTRQQTALDVMDSFASRLAAPEAMARLFPLRKRDAGSPTQVHVEGEPDKAFRTDSTESAGLDPSMARQSNSRHFSSVSGVPYMVAAKNLTAAVTLLFKPDPLMESSGLTGRRWRMVGIASIFAAAWLILWGTWLRQHSYAPARAAQWSQSSNASDAADSDFEMPEFQSPAKEQASAPVSRVIHHAGEHEIIADPSFTDLGLSRASAKAPLQTLASNHSPGSSASPARSSGAVRTALPQTAPSDIETNPPRKSNRRGFLGLGKVWHWVRRGDPVAQPAPAQPGPAQ